MKRKLFLHVGPPKTGTTTLQHFLAANRDPLLQAGILYPLDEPSHWKLALRSGLIMWPWTVDESTTPTWEDVRQASLAHFDKDLLLSSESFSYAFLSAKEGGATHFIEQIKSLGREIQVLIYLRRQDLWLESYFIEYLKHYGEGGFETFVGVRNESLQYDKVLSFWADIVGKDALTVRLYERGQMSDFQGDFLKWLGISGHREFQKVENKNHRPSLLQMQILNTYVAAFHRHFPKADASYNKPFGPLDQMLGSFMYKTSDWPSTRHYRILPFETARQILDECAEANAKVAKEYFGRQDGKLFMEELLPYENDPLDWPGSLNAGQLSEVASLWQKTCELMAELYGATPAQLGDSDFDKLLHPPVSDSSSSSSSYSVERYLPEMRDFQISYEHWHRYFFATQFATGKSVLDIACGEGYGTALLAEYAADVTGIDIDTEVIRAAKEKYCSGNISFLQGSVTDIPVEGSAVFDLIVSFETIEHVEEVAQLKFLAEVLRLLRPGGVFIVSTPDKLTYTDQPHYRNTFHVREFYAEEFTSFLKGFFSNVQMLGQDIYTASYLHTAASKAQLEEYNLTSKGGFHPGKNLANNDSYLVAVCSERQLPPLPHSLLFNSENKLAQYDYSYQVLYVDTGGGFNEEESLLAQAIEKRATIRFDLSRFSDIKSLRLDPAACPVCLRLHGVTLEYAAPGVGGPLSIPLSDITTNALQQDDTFFLFDTGDPQIFFGLPAIGHLKAIRIDLEYIALGTAVYPYLKSWTVPPPVEGQAKVAEQFAPEDPEEAEVNYQFLLRALQGITEQQNAQQQKLAEQADTLLMQKAQVINALTQRLENMGSLLREVQAIFKERLADLQADKTAAEQELTVAASRQETLQQQLSIAYSEVEALQKELAQRDVRVEALNRQVAEQRQQTWNMDARVAVLENAAHEREKAYVRLEKGYGDQARYLTEVKNSISFRLGWALTAPFRWIYESFKLKFWLRFASIAGSNSHSFFQHFNAEKIKVLRKALKNEPPSLILTNFANLLRNKSPHQLVVPSKEESRAPEPPQAAPEAAPEVPVIHHFIDEFEELDFHVSLRGWLFAEEQEVTALFLSMEQGGQVARTAVFYKIDRPDVFNHYGNKNGLKSGFADSIEKPFTGKVQIHLHAVIANGQEVTLDMGEVEFRRSELFECSRAIRVNRSVFYDSLRAQVDLKQVIDIYTHTRGNYFFNEIRSLIAAGFRTLGYQVRELSEKDRYDPESLLHVVVAPHEFFEIGGAASFSQNHPHRLVLLNTEQPSSIWFRKAAAYFSWAIEVWDMNFYSWQCLSKTLGWASFLPLGFVKNFNLFGEVRSLPDNYCTCFLDENIRKRSYLNSRFEDRPIDILFVGHASPRRQQFFAAHAAFFARYNCYFHLTDLSLGPVQDEGNAMNTRTAIGLAQRSKIILNIHHGSHPYFEWHRMVMHGIWQRGLVVSDLCGEGPPFVPGKHFVQAPLEEVPERIAYFLETAAGRTEANEIIHAAWATLTGECDLASTLQSHVQALFSPQALDPSSIASSRQ